MTTTTTDRDRLALTIAREMAAHLFAFLPKPDSVIWTARHAWIHSLECTPGHVQFRVFFNRGASSTDIGTSDTSVRGIQELGRMAGGMISDAEARREKREAARNAPAIKEENHAATVAGCEVSLELFEENGEQRSSCFIVRNRCSASLEWAENEGYLDAPDGSMRPISDKTVARIRNWATARGY